MNSGMNFLIPQENGAIHNEVPWIPVTPEKPVTLENRVIFPGDPLIPVTPETPVMQQNRVIYNWDAWIPGTPEMPVIRQPSAPITGEMQRGVKKCVNMHQQFGLQGQVSAEKPVVEGTYPIPGEVRGDLIERTSWSELLEFCSGVLQETPTNDALQDLHPDGLLGHIEHKKPNVGTVWDNGYVNQSAGSHVQNFIVDVNGTRGRSVCATGKLPLISLHPAVGNEWARNQFDGSVLLQQKQALSANQGIVSSGMQKLPNEVFPVPYKPLYALNSSPEPESTVVSSTVNCFQFATVTPDKGKRLRNNQLYDVQNISGNESLGQEQHKQELIFTNSQAENLFDELLHNVVTAPSASNSASPKGKNVYEDRDHRGIDMNKTPQQRPPKRKKHRPKVVVEGKPKKTPKPTTSKAKVSDENPSGKRKYVRRKGLETSYSTPGNETKGGEASARTSAKSCRRALNFDLESEIPDKSEDKVIDDQESRKLMSKHFDLNKNSQDSICSTRVNKVLDISLTTEGQQNGRNEDILQGKNTRIIIGDNNQKLAEQSLSVSLTASPTTGRDHTLNAIARNLSLQTATSCQRNDHSGYNQGHQLLNGEGIGQMLLQTNSSLTKLDATQMLMLQSSTQFLKGFAEGKETNRSKSDHWHISQMMNPKFVDLSHSQFLHHDISRNVEQNEDSSKTEIVTDETMKHKVSCCGPSGAASIQYCSKQSESRGFNNAPKSISSCFYGRLPNYNLEMQNKIMKQNIGGNGICSDQGTNTTTAGNASQELRSSSAIEHLKHLLARINHHQNAKIQTLHVTTGKIECLPSRSPRLSSTTQGNGIKACPADLLVKMQTVIPTSSIQTFSKEKLYPNKSTKEIVSQKSSMKAKGLKERRNCAATIDEITYRLKGLHISKSRKKVVAKEQNAIVPYKGDDKVVVFEGFHPIKIRRPRPKVDLDAETKRLWNLLMGKDGAENTETMDSGKEKWWEEQRKLVRGRIDSFIARMHLVQGDRRFSQWKGSVVDSVIGVFLTQNVSDHLSSSAFMSLAAKFPFPSSNSKTTYCEPISSTEEPGAQIIDPDGTIAYHGRNISQPFYKQNSMTLSESSERQSLNIISETGVHYASENNSGTEEEVVSSQNSSDSFPRSTKYMRSSSDSEVEDQIRVCSSMNCISENTPKSERVYMYQQYQCPIMTDQLIDKSPMPRLQQHENPARIRLQGSNNESNSHAYPVNSDVLCMQGSLSPFSVSSNKTSESRVNGSYRSGYSEHKSVPIFLPTCTDISKTGGAAHSRQEAAGITESTSCSFTQETRMPVNHVIRMGQPRCLHQPKDNSQPEFHFVSSQKSTDSDLVRISKSFHQTEKSATEAKRLDNTDATRQNGNVCFSSETLSTTETNIPNARKRKHNVDKGESFDWDCLRKKVLKKLRKKERSQDNMDSLDYEALRRADVKTISDTILERGMNNMLAERIKDFLDRLVREHGSVDLEWLRDVSADEAKDFLLSIRGLGLKSVECVRLLTLHQIAFPVDTNVGRIAVRLGWVPIQPLPESLQLHLLELYPVLESIQKYLWPRLCKLDQRTLYELHYQLITFGKVFCTKKKPNCNACPMRAECRHFASAFASARLALPGPEERRMVNSTTPMGSYDVPSVIVKPIPLPPAKTNMGFASHYSRSNSLAGSEERSMVNSTTPMASYDIPSAIVNPIPLLHVETNMGFESHYSRSNCVPIIEEPATPESSPEVSESDIEDLFSEDPDEIPTIKLSFEELKMNVQSIMQEQNIDIEPSDISRALVALDSSAASIPAPKLKNVSRLRTEHQVYEIPDSHPLLKGMERREPDDPSPYLLAIWGPGETADSSQPPPESCSPCTCLNEKNSHTVRGTFLIPCRTAMRGSFPLNGTYFQVNEMFADHETSNNPIDVPRDWLWRLPRRTVYFGTSVTSIFRGLSTEGIQYCFWRGFVCVRGFDRKQRAPRPLRTRLHETATKAAKNKEKNTHKWQTVLKKPKGGVN